MMISQTVGKVSRTAQPQRSLVRVQRSRAARSVQVQAGPNIEPEFDIENPDSEARRKKDEIDRLRKQEKFMKVGNGEADCIGCGYNYLPKQGDPDYPISPGTKFQDLPDDWQCPVCGAERRTFQVNETEIAGFAANQGYGLGTNSMTGGQKSLLIYGSLAAFFALFLLGYGMQ